MRSSRDVVRGGTLSFVVDGRPVTAFEGETLASAMIEGNARVFRLDSSGKPRGLFCNMGVCSECLVDVASDGLPTRRVRACITAAAAGMIVSTGSGS